MGETPQFTINAFYDFIKQRKLKGARCKKCDKLLVPPRPMCSRCFSKDLEWEEIKHNGKLLTYTIIHISPKKFQSRIPYAVGIVELEDGANLPGILKDVDLESIKIGMKLTLDFETETPQEDWPQWPRYFFKELKTAS